MRPFRLACASVTAFVLGAGLVGCSTVPDHSHTTEVVIRPMPSVTKDAAQVSVDWVQFDDNSVVVRINGYRHTLNSGVTVIHPNQPDTPDVYVPAQSKSAPEKHSSVKTQPLPPYANTDDQMAAWKDWCAGKDISDAQYELVSSTRLPMDAPFDCDEFHRTAWRK